MCTHEKLTQQTVKSGHVQAWVKRMCQRWRHYMQTGSGIVSNVWPSWTCWSRFWAGLWGLQTCVRCQGIRVCQGGRLPLGSAAGKDDRLPAKHKHQITHFHTTVNTQQLPHIFIYRCVSSVIEHKQSECVYKCDWRAVGICVLSIGSPSFSLCMFVWMDVGVRDTGVINGTGGPNRSLTHESLQEEELEQCCNQGEKK